MAQIINNHKSTTIGTKFKSEAWFLDFLPIPSGKMGFLQDIQGSSSLMEF